MHEVAQLLPPVGTLAVTVSTWLLLRRGARGDEGTIGRSEPDDQHADAEAGPAAFTSPPD